MGSACCVASRDRTITNGTSRGDVPRNLRYSPSWSVRRDNIRRVAGEEASINWFSDDLGINYRLDNKSQSTVGTAYASEEGSPLESFSNLTWQKSSPSEGYSVPQSDQSIYQITPDVRESTKTRFASEPSPMTMSSSTDSVSPCMLSGFSNESNRGSLVESNHGSLVTSSDGWYAPAFNELITTSHSHRKTWSFDGAPNNTNRDKISSRTSIDMQTCGICSVLLTERPSWGTHKFITPNEVAVVAILICGHVYHSECLESITSEINKYDPACPVCTFGEKKVMKLESKARINKKFKSRVVDGDDILFDCHKISPKMSLSSSMKSSLGKQFLKRHFSFSSKGSRLADNNFSSKKGLLWSKSSKE